MNTLNDNDKRSNGSYASPKTGKVVPLRIVDTTFEPDAELVEFIESLLTRAKAGEINGIAIATASPAAGEMNQGHGNGWTGIPGTMHTLVTATAVLHARMVAACAP